MSIRGITSVTVASPDPVATSAAWDRLGVALPVDVVPVGEGGSAGLAEVGRWSWEDSARALVAVVREGLSNIARHAHASSATVDILLTGVLPGGSVLADVDAGEAAAATDGAGAASPLLAPADPSAGPARPPSADPNKAARPPRALSSARRMAT